MIVVVIVVLLLLAAFGAVLVNGLVSLRRQTQHAFGQIELQLKRRCDAVPNLIEVLKGEVGRDESTLENLANARELALSARTVSGKASAENLLHRSINRVFAVVEAHPDMQQNREVLALRESFRSTQNKIAFASQYYNDVARKYNERLESFPWNIFSAGGGFHPIDPFEVEALPTREPTPVKF